MVVSKNPQAAGWNQFLTSACFVFLSLMITSTCLSQNQEEYPTRSIIGFPVFTPQQTIRCAEGELGLYVGEDRKPVTPLVWQSPKPGQIRFQVEENDYRLEFDVAYAETLSVSHAITGVVVHCTAVGNGSNNSQAVVWCVWRHSPEEGEEERSTGIALVSSIQEKIEVRNHIDPWHPKLTWYFQNQEFIRNNSILYWVEETGGWSLSHQVRDNFPPFTSLRPSHWLGWTKLTASIKPNQSLSFRILTPYVPISKE